MKHGYETDAQNNWDVLWGMKHVCFNPWLDNAVRCGAVRCGAVRRGALYSMVLYDVTCYYATLWYDILSHGAVYVCGGLWPM